MSRLRAELRQCREDLANDERIFADQQIDFEQVKCDLVDKISGYEDEVHQLKLEINKLKSGVEDNLNTTLKKKTLKITRSKPCTFTEIEEIMRKKTFVVFEQNIKNCLEHSGVISKPSKPEPGMLDTYVVPVKCSIKDHSLLENSVKQLKRVNSKLESEVKQLKESTLSVHEAKKNLEKNCSLIRKQKSDLEKR